MRLAIVVTSGRGGLLHYAVQMADGLAAREHDVDTIVPKGHELTGHRGPARLLEILPLPVAGGEEPANRAAYVRRRAGIALRILRGWGHINLRARRGRYDAVVVAEDLDLLPTVIAAGGLTLGRRRPLVAYVCHNVRRFNRWGGDDMLLDPSSDPIRFLYPRLDLVFVHGTRSREEFERYWPPVALAEIPHGDEGLFSEEPPPPSDEEHVLFFGDWRKIKGLTVLMEAFDRLAERRPEARLTIAGTPAPSDFDPDVVRRWAAERADRVVVNDRYIPVEEVRPLFAAARVVVTPYLVGYQSGVVHLAQTMARPVVTSDVGDLPLAVRDGETGRVVPPGDAEALARALEDVLADPSAAAAMGTAAHARVASAASWDTVAEAMERALEPLLVSR